ncbi:MAG TPA: amidohydrolase family protein [Vicinamibacterales bacterium]|nr:amidohydrolase family protein [Vicinamibacterales bacterium]
MPLTPALIRTSFVIALSSTLAASAMQPQDPPPSQEKPAEKPADKKDEPKKKHDLPLKTDRVLEFETDEATWLSLDVTPDGQAIVFELAGDLYRVPMAGGTATRITDGLPYDAQPRVSPDGRRIAFISDRNGSDNLWIANIDGTEPRKLSNETQQAVISPAWTPDSQYVIASVRATGGTQLRMFHVDGGSGITLGAAAAPEGGRGGAPGGAATTPNRLGATLSPDGRYLYAAQSGGGGGAALPGWQIVRLDMKTGDADVITQGGGRAFRPLVSPDGNLLVYASRHETQTGLRVRDLNTGADRQLVWPVQRDEMESGGSPSRDLFPGYAFTPDSKALLTTKDGKIQKVDIATGAMTMIPFTAKVQLEVGPDLEAPYRVEQGPVRARLIQDPRQSPDGKRLAMSVLTKLYIKDLPAGETKRLTSGDAWEFKPTWSPDGQWIAYVTWSMDTGGHIWKTRADGSGQPQRLTSVPAFYTDLAFSPDGSRIVGLRGSEFMRHQTDSEFGGLRIPLDLVWLPSGGGNVELIVPARGLGYPHFTAEADRVYVYANAGLISLRYDGTDRRTHLRVTGPSRPGATTPPAANAVLMRPDGKWALAAVNNQLWVVAVPPFTGTAASVSVRGPAVPVKRLTDIGADYFAWADEGKTITWAIGSTYFRRAFDTISFAPEPDAGRAGGANAPTTPTTPKDPLDLDRNVEAFEVALEFPRAKPSGTVVLRGATVITMNGDEVIRNADVVVTDNRIASVGRRGAARVPAGAKVVDVSGKYIVPGFIDTHAHWEFRTHDVLEPQNWSLAANLAYGVTAGLDVQTSTNDYFAYQDLVDTGQTVGQRAFMTGPGVFSGNDFQSYEATLAYLKRYKQHYRTPNIKSYMVGNRKQRQWVVQASKELGLMPTTEGGRDQKLDTTHAIDGMHGNEHTLPVVPLFKDTVEIFAQTKTAYTPTLLVQYGGPMAEHYFYTRGEVHDDPKLQRFYPHNRLDEMTRRRGTWARDDEFTFDEAAAQAAKIQRAGGLIGVGGHGQVQGLGYHWEMWAFAMGGMTPREVLKAATIDGARIIGFEQDLGSIEAGKLADLVVLDRNPLENIRNTNTVRWVMKNGELYEGDTLTQVWPVQKPLPKFWWHTEK